MSELNHVIALTKLHIAQHYENSERIFTDPETLKYYQDFAQKNKPASPTRPKAAQIPAATPQKIKPVPRPAEPKQKAIVQEKVPASTLPGPLSIQREKLKPAAPPEFSDFREILQKHFPTLELLDSPPNDSKAREQSLIWQKENSLPEILFLYDEPSPPEHLFLQNLARAIDTVFFPAALIPCDQFDSNHQYRLVIGTKTHLKDYQGPRFTIDTTSQYLQNPLSKAKLWQDLKNTLQSS